MLVEKKPPHYDNIIYVFSSITFRNLCTYAEKYLIILTARLKAYHTNNNAPNFLTKTKLNIMIPH